MATTSEMDGMGAAPVPSPDPLTTGETSDDATTSSEPDGDSELGALERMVVAVPREWEDSSAPAQLWSSGTVGQGGGLSKLA